MGNSENVQCWSKTAASNDGIDSGIGSVNDSSSPTSVDNWERSTMASIAKWADDTGGALAAGGTANALTVATNQVLSSGQVADGLRILLKATADNTSATVTFAPDGLTAANIKRADGSALAVGSIQSGMYLDLVYNSGSSEWRAVNISPDSGVSAPGLVYLTSGTVAAATLDIVLTAYTQYRGIKIFLSGFRPATDGQFLWMRFSTDGGSTYITTASYSFATALVDSAAAQVLSGASGGSAIVLTTSAGNGVGSAATEGLNAEITMLNQASAAFFTRVKYEGSFMDSAATSKLLNFNGSGAYLVAQDTDAVRFMFSSGNITAGNYAVYGLI